MINTLQFIAFFSEWRSSMPPKARLAIMTFRQIALGEFMDFSFIKDPMKDAFLVPGEDPNSSSLSNLGFFLFLILILGPLICCVIAIGKVKRIRDRVGQKIDKIKQKLLWNSMLRFVLQSILKLSITVFLAMALAKFSDGTSSVNALINIVMIIAFISAPIAFAYILYRN